jgi:hypothetical protein
LEYRTAQHSQFQKFASTHDVPGGGPPVAQIPDTDSPTQVTLEGVSGMVVMDGNSGSKKEDEDDEQKNEEGILPYDEVELKKGESGGASSSSSSDRLNTEGQNSADNPEDEAGI